MLNLKASTSNAKVEYNVDASGVGSPDGNGFVRGYQSAPLKFMILG